MKRVVWAGAIVVAAVVLVAGLSASGIIDDWLKKKPQNGNDDISKSAYGNITIDGFYTDSSPVSKYLPGLNRFDNGQYGELETNLVAEKAYYFTLISSITDYGLLYFRSMITPIDATTSGTTVVFNYVIDIRSQDQITTNDVLASKRMSLYDVGDPNTSSGPSSVQGVQVDANTVRLVMTAEPFIGWNDDAYFPHFNASVMNDDASLRARLAAVGPSAVFFKQPGNYTMTVYLADMSNGTVSRNIASSTIISPKSQRDVLIHPNRSVSKDVTYLWDTPRIDAFYRNITFENTGIMSVDATLSNLEGQDMKVRTDYYCSVSASVTVSGTQWFRSNLVPYSNQVYDEGQYRLNVTPPRFVIDITNPSGISADDINISTDLDQHLYGGGIYPASYGTGPSFVTFIQVDDNTIRGILRGQPWQYAQANFGVGKQYVRLDWINDDYLRAMANCGFYFLKEGDYEISVYLASYDYVSGAVNRSLASNTMFSPIIKKDFHVGPSDLTSKVEPLVSTSLDKSGQFGPGPWPMGQSFFGESSSGTIDTWVERKADTTHVGIMVYFLGMSNNEVYVNASYGNGEPQWVNLYDDGTLGCFGMLMTDQSNILGDKAWTWAYAPNDKAQYYNITLSVTTYSLGTHEVRFYAYDQDTGKRISDIEITSYTVYGRSTYGEYWMFNNNMSTDMPSSFVPGQIYNFTFSDTCRYNNYDGMVRSVLQIPYAEKVWLVNGDGSSTLLTPGENGYYSFTWQYGGGMSTHSVHLMVQLGLAEGSYPWSMGHYWVEDVITGMNMSIMLGEGWSGLSFEIRGAS